MASRYSLPVTKSAADLIDLSDVDGFYSVSDDEPEQLGPYNHQLGQALNYLQQEGGDDSPPTFMDRINRINETLLIQSPQQGHTFDPTLYKQVRAMVLKYKRDFNDAVNGSSPQIEDDEEWSDASAPTTSREALYRADTESPTPTPTHSPVIASRTAKTEASARKLLAPINDNVQRVRIFKYGGPRNEAEEWCKEAPPTFPFGETFLMAHWESLKIDYDLAKAAKDGGVAETDVPMDHVQLQPYFKLSQYESGSRFRLPLVSNKIQDTVSRYGTADRLSEVVSDLCELDQSGGGPKHYAPRVVLENFQVGHQDAPTVISLSQLRSSMAGTPSKRRVTNVTKKGTTSSKRSSPPLIEDCVYDTDNPSAGLSGDTLTALTPNAGRAASIGRALITPLSASNTARTPVTPLRASDTTKVLITWPSVPKSQVRASPAFRRISREVQQALREDNLSEQATSISKPVFPKPQTRKVASHVAISQCSRGRPRKNLLPVESSSASKVPESVLGKRSRGRPRKDSQSEETTSAPKTPVKSTLGKRKPSIGSRTYTTPPSAIKKVLRDAKRLRITASDVISYADNPTDLEEDSEDPRYMSTPCASPAIRSMAKKVSKATAAGAMVRKMSTQDRLDVERVGRTRSGRA